MNRFRDTPGSAHTPDRAPARTSDLEEQIASLGDELRRSVRHVCPAWLRGHCDDLVQQALMRLLDLARKSGGIEERGTSYLRKVAYSVTVDEIRRHHRRAEVNVGDGPILEFRATREPSPEREAGSREIDRAITDCLAGLIRSRRLVVTLHLQGYSVPEAARSLGWTTKRAEHLTYRGLGDLRKCLENKGVRP